jgi:hypothetical protein
MSLFLFKRHAACTALLCLGLSGWSVGAAAQSWSYCAQEDEICQVRGQAVVRYGANGQYEYRQTNGPMVCSNQNFGDPAPKQRKDCSVSYHPNAWREANSAAQRGGHHGGAYPSTYPSHSYPAPAPVSSGSGDWRTCAMEDEFCSFRGVREVRFGAEGRYHVRTASDGVLCHVREFGDPNDGARKHCQVRNSGGSTHQSGGYNTNSYPAPVPSNNPYNNRHWRLCAEEDGLCNAPINAMVRFGAEGRYAYAERVQGPIPCSVHTFGDPNKGVRKVCEYAVR